MLIKLTGFVHRQAGLQALAHGEAPDGKGNPSKKSCTDILYSAFSLLVLNQAEAYTGPTGRAGKSVSTG